MIKLDEFSMAFKIIDEEIMAYSLNNGEIDFDDVGILNKCSKELAQAIKDALDITSDDLEEVYGVEVIEDNEIIAV